MADRFEKNSRDIDELIRNMQQTLDESDARMGAKPPKAEVRKEPAFRPELPREYAELKLEPKKPAPPEPPQKTRLPAGARTFIYVGSVLLASMLLAFFIWICADDVCALTRQEQVVTVTVEDSDDVSKVADTLKENGLIRMPWLFKLYCSVTNAEQKITPGTYDLNTIFDYHALVNGMAANGRRATTTVMIPEGYECREIFALLEERGVCTADALWNAAADTDFDYPFLEGVPLGDKNRLEGCLFPDTYEFYLDDDAEAVLNKLLRNMDDKLTEEYWTALDDLNAVLRAKKASSGFSEEEINHGELSMYDVLIVASLIERETAGTRENGIIASVIYNRLSSKAYPHLNIDATIQYILPERKEVLSDTDKLIDSPYNTYKYPGLPVGAIANPGLMAIRGALFPQDTDYYFYALDRNGAHRFNRTYEEHLAFLEELKHEET